MAKPNYAFAKRQRDLSKKQKKEEKRAKKVGTKDDAPDESETSEATAPDERRAPD